MLKMIQTGMQSGEPMKTTRIYFEADNLKAFIDWLKTEPGGACQVLIGDDTHQFKAADVVEVVGAESRLLASWLLLKVQSGMMQVKVSEKVDLPVGVALETNQE